MKKAISIVLSLVSLLAIPAWSEDIPYSHYQEMLAGGYLEKGGVTIEVCQDMESQTPGKLYLRCEVFRSGPAEEFYNLQLLNVTAGQVNFYLDERYAGTLYLADSVILDAGHGFIKTSDAYVFIMPMVLGQVPRWCIRVEDEHVPKWQVMHIPFPCPPDEHWRKIGEDPVEGRCVCYFAGADMSIQQMVETANAVKANLNKYSIFEQYLAAAMLVEARARGYKGNTPEMSMESERFIELELADLCLGQLNFGFYLRIGSQAGDNETAWKNKAIINTIDWRLQPWRQPTLWKFKAKPDN